MHRVLQAVLMLAAALQQSASAITAPVNGQNLRAQVTISGTIEAANFASAELAFAYAHDPTDTWFLIQVVSQPVQDGVLGIWDTADLTDGSYRLRLRVYAPDGSFQDAVVNDLQLRNELASPTSTPEATSATATPESISTGEQEPAASELPPVMVLATLTPHFPTPLPLPPNPAAIAAESVYSILGRGALLALILFTVLGIFLRLRRP